MRIQRRCVTNDEKFSGKERAEAKVKIKLTVRTNFITTCRKAPIQRSRHCHLPNNYQHYCDDSPATCVGGKYTKGCHAASSWDLDLAPATLLLLLLLANFR